MALQFAVIVAITGIIGIPIKALLENHFSQHIVAVSPFLIANGILIFVASRVFGAGQRTIANLRLNDLILFGIAQGLATTPGLSRLGLTLVVALAIKLTWSEALRFSFLLSIPTILAANLYLLANESIGSLVSLLNVIDVAVIVLTFSTSILCLQFLTRYIVLGRSVLQFFGIYCISAGTFFWLYLQLF